MWSYREITKGIYLAGLSVLTHLIRESRPHPTVDIGAIRVLD
jgi:hypothetical protein